MRLILSLAAGWTVLSLTVAAAFSCVMRAGRRPPPEPDDLTRQLARLTDEALVYWLYHRSEIVSGAAARAIVERSRCRAVGSADASGVTVTVARPVVQEPEPEASQ